MYWLTEDARMVCSHESGHVEIVATQSLVTINGRRVLVAKDPEGRSIQRCPYRSPGGQKPCLLTLNVVEGYSTLIRIDGRPVCLDTVRGKTDGAPGSFDYAVRRPGQDSINERQ